MEKILLTKFLEVSLDIFFPSLFKQMTVRAFQCSWPAAGWPHMQRHTHKATGAEQSQQSGRKLQGSLQCSGCSSIFQHTLTIYYHPAGIILIINYLYLLLLSTVILYWKSIVPYMLPHTLPIPLKNFCWDSHHVKSLELPGTENLE